MYYVGVCLNVMQTTFNSVVTKARVVPKKLKSGKFQLKDKRVQYLQCFLMLQYINGPQFEGNWNVFVQDFFGCPKHGACLSR